MWLPICVLNDIKQGEISKRLTDASILQSNIKFMEEREVLPKDWTKRMIDPSRLATAIAFVQVVTKAKEDHHKGENEEEKAKNSIVQNLEEEKRGKE